MKMIAIFLAILIVSHHTMVNADALPKKCALSLAEANSKISQDGVEKTYNAYIGSRWEGLKACIASGEDGWIKIGSLFTQFADGHYGEELDLVLGEALVANPSGVLRITQREIPKPIPLRDICSGPDVDDQRFDSYQLSVEEIGRRENAVSKVSDQKLKGSVAECLNDLKSARSWMTHIYGASHS